MVAHAFSHQTQLPLVPYRSWSNPERNEFIDQPLPDGGVFRGRDFVLQAGMTRNIARRVGHEGRLRPMPCYWDGVLDLHVCYSVDDIFSKDQNLVSVADLS